MKTLPVCVQKDHVLQHIHTQNITNFDETLWLYRPAVRSEGPVRGGNRFRGQATTYRC